jgi:ubiquinone/menaquinone biosynthesis C-methylase UbiE
MTTVSSRSAQAEQRIQRAYYANTASRYDDMHVHDSGEHYFALGLLRVVIELLDVKSVLDIGSGTGRALLMLKEWRPDLRIVGVEPSAELRLIGYQKGLSYEELVDGDAMALSQHDGSFDLVTEFGALHHIPAPSKAVEEMLRVSRVGIFISDSNNFGQGSRPARLAKQILHFGGIWPVYNWIKTGGKGYKISEGDGLAYSYSVYNDWKQIRRACQSVHVLNTQDGGINPYRSSTHVALLGLKEQRI